MNMNTLNESYKILGLNNTASIEEVKQAYRKLSKKFHPDMNDGDTFFADKFKELNTAYQYILSNQDSRNQQYNTQEEKKTKEEYRNESAEVPKNKSSNTKDNTNPVPIYSFIFLLLAGVAAITHFANSSQKKGNNVYVQEEAIPKQNDINQEGGYSINTNNEIAPVDEVLRETLSIEQEQAKLEEEAVLVQAEEEEKRPEVSSPTRNESIEWLVSKLKRYTRSRDYSPVDELGIPIRSKTKTNYSEYKFWSDKENLIVTYRIKLLSKYVSPETLDRLNGYDLQELAYMQSTEYRVSKDEKIKVIIPFYSISSTKFLTYKASDGLCPFGIFTDLNKMTKINLTTGKKTFTSYFDMEYDCSEDEKLGERLDKALMHIKELSSSPITSGNEPF